MNALLMLAAEAPLVPGGSSIVIGLIYFLIAVLVLFIVWKAISQFAPQYSQAIGAILAVVLLLIALKIFGIF